MENELYSKRLKAFEVGMISVFPGANLLRNIREKAKNKIVFFRHLYCRFISQLTRSDLEMRLSVI
jgi:hypothetical protein